MASMVGTLAQPWPESALRRAARDAGLPWVLRRHSIEALALELAEHVEWLVDRGAASGRGYALTWTEEGLAAARLDFVAVAKSMAESFGVWFPGESERAVQQVVLSLLSERSLMEAARTRWVTLGYSTREAVSKARAEWIGT